MKGQSNRSPIIANMVLELAPTLRTKEAARFRMKTIGARFCEHTRGAAVSEQPHHRPERVIILDTDGVITSFSIVCPQTARVQQVALKSVLYRII